MSARRPKQAQRRRALRNRCTHALEAEAGRYPCFGYGNRYVGHWDQGRHGVMVWRDDDAAENRKHGRRQL